MAGPTPEPVAESTPEPSDSATTEAPEPQPEETAAPTEEPPEPAGEETAAAEGETGEPTQATEQPQLAEGLQDTQTAEAPTTAADSAVPTDAQTSAGGDGRSLHSQAIPQPVLDPRASIGDLDCTDLTVPVTLDNSRSQDALVFVVRAEIIYQFVLPLETREVAAGAVDIFRVPVAAAEDAQLRIDVSLVTPDGPRATWALLPVDCSPNTSNTTGPRASIADMDCGTLTVPVTLDNTRWFAETTFYVWAQDQLSEFFDNFPALTRTVELAAGTLRVVNIPVTEDVRVWVGVADQPFPDGAFYGNPYAEELIDVDCAPGRGFTTAAVGQVDCQTMTLPVRVDNSRVNHRVFELDVVANPNRGRAFFSAFSVGASQVRVVRVPVTNHSRVKVFVLMNVSQTLLEPSRLLAEWIIDVKCTSSQSAPLPRTAVEGAKLPQTGGFNLALPLLGVALLAGGGGMLALSRRRPRN
ncbi:MAG: LPXTG cell wall anchor domain-containing protein [Sporichthyaceae bacterium]